MCDESHQEPNEGEWPSSSGASQLLTSDLSGCSSRTPWKNHFKCVNLSDVNKSGAAATS